MRNEKINEHSITELIKLQPRSIKIEFDFKKIISNSSHCFSNQKGKEMPLGLITSLGRAWRRKRTSSLDILSSKRAPRDYYKGKNCKPTGFHTRKGGYVLVKEKLPNYVVPDLTNFTLKAYVSQCPREVKTSQAADTAQSA